MGHALALVFALGGHQVRLTDTNAETLERAPGLMATALATLAEAGEVDASLEPPAPVARGALRSVAGGYGGRRQAVVIEAIVERPDAKRALYEQLQPLMDADAILASNTSNLDIFPLVPDGLAEAHDHRALVHAALSVRPGRSLPRPADRSRRHRHRARHGARDGQGAGRVQADGAGLRRQPAAGGDGAGGATACSTRAW